MVLYVGLKTHKTLYICSFQAILCRHVGCFENLGKKIIKNISVRRKACAPQLMPLSIGFPDEKQFKGACPKSRRDDRTQTGVLTPGKEHVGKRSPEGATERPIGLRTTH